MLDKHVAIEAMGELRFFQISFHALFHPTTRESHATRKGCRISKVHPRSKRGFIKKGVPPQCFHKIFLKMSFNAYEDHDTSIKKEIANSRCQRRTLLRRKVFNFESYFMGTLSKRGEKVRYCCQTRKTKFSGFVFVSYLGRVFEMVHCWVLDALARGGLG